MIIRGGGTRVHSIGSDGAGTAALFEAIGVPAALIERLAREIGTARGVIGINARGIAAYTRLGTGVRVLGHATDWEAGEPIVPLTWHTERKPIYPTLTRRMQFYVDHDWYLELDEHLPRHKASP